MDPKQTSPLGAPQVGGQEGQPVQPTPAVGDVSGANSPAATPAAPISPAPVFSTGTEQPATSTPQKMAGDLGAESLSTGANVSRTMDNLNDANQSATGAPIFAKHKFDKIEYATGDILLNKDDPKPKRRFFGGSSAPRPKSAAEISREARREAKRLRKLNKAGGSAVEAIPTPAEPASTKPSLLSSKNFKLAIGAIVGVLVIVAGILGVVALSNNKNSSKPSRPNTTIASSEEAAKEAFTDYLSYLFWGDDGENVVVDAWNKCVKENCIDTKGEYGAELNDLIKTAKDTKDYLEIAWKLNDRDIFPFYAERKMLETTSNQRTAYFEELNKKWNDFLNVYNGLIRETPRQTDVSLFFYDMAMVGNLDESNIIGIYRRNKDNITNDKNPAIDEILLNISTDSDDPAVIEYLGWKQEYLIRELLFIENAEQTGCIKESSAAACGDQVAGDSYEEYQSSLLSNDLEYLKKRNAIAALKSIYTELFTDEAKNDTEEIV